MHLHSKLSKELKNDFEILKIQAVFKFISYHIIIISYQTLFQYHTSKQMHKTRHDQKAKKA